MADSIIQVYPDSTGKMIDTSSLTVSAQTVQRQRMNIADPTGSTGIAGVNAKGTQGAFALAVQRLHDAGRSAWSMSWDAVAGVTSEALVTASYNLAGTVTSGTSYTITSGKTLRLTSISVDMSGSTAGTLKLILRSATPALAITSPLIFRSFTAITAANTADHKQQTWPEGLELAGGQAVGISQIASVTTVNSTITINGYEY